MRTKIDKTYLRLVNRKNPLDSHKPDYYDYEEVLIRIPNYEVSSDDIVIEKGENSSIVRTFIEKRTNQAFEELKADLDRKGVNTRINEAGRTAEKQQLYRDRALEKERKYADTDKNYVNYADNYVAKPYETEHGLGTALDLGVFSKSFSKIKHPKIKDIAQKVVKPRLYAIMHRVAVKHGFITRYPIRYNLTNVRRAEISNAKAGNNITLKTNRREFQKLNVQYNYEPWHETYVGEYNAQFMTANKLTLEEYVKLVDIYEAYANDIGDDNKCPSLQDFYNLYTLGTEWDRNI